MLGFEGARREGVAAGGPVAARVGAFMTGAKAVLGASIAMAIALIQSVGFAERWAVFREIATEMLLQADR